MSRSALVFGLLGVASLIVWAAGLAVDPHHTLMAWAAAYAFFAATVVGALVLTMVLHVTHARWWFVFRPMLMAFVSVTPLCAVAFLPVAFGFQRVYPWAGALPHDLPQRELAVVLHQRTWNEPRLFLVRAAIYLGAWSLLAWRLQRADAAYDRAPTADNVARLRRISAAGLPIIAFTLTFASFDWVMSLEQAWTSNLLGLYVFTSGFVATLAVVLVAAWSAFRAGTLPRGVEGAHFHALGRLLLMSVILWAYIAFFQLLLVWIADLPREVTFYLARSRGALGVFAWVLVLGGFFAPLLALLDRALKRRPGALALVAGWLFVMHALDFAWLVLGADGHVRVLDLAPFFAVSALAAAYAVQRFRAKHVLAPALEPALAEALDYRSP